ncbi:MAG TPA: hypothetical protein VIT00_15320 [Terrimicrobiaceae bacterium]
MEEVYLSCVKLPLLVIVGSAASAVLTSCTTLENRADLYSPRNYYANGPYTRMLHSGIPKVETVFVQATASRSGSGQAFSPYYGK